MTCCRWRNLLLFHEPQLPIARPACAMVEFLSFKISLCSWSLPARSWGWPWLTKWQTTTCTCGQQMVSAKSKGISDQLSSIKRMIVFSWILKFVRTKADRRKTEFQTSRVLRFALPHRVYSSRETDYHFFIIDLLVQFGLVCCWRR